MKKEMKNKMPGKRVFFFFCLQEKRIQGRGKEFLNSLLPL